MTTKELYDKWRTLLMPALLDAHYRAASNPSISNQTFLMVAEGSGNPVQAIAAAILSIGDKHGPLTKTRELMSFFAVDYQRGQGVIRNMLQDNVKIPGIGNSFFKDKIDPAFQEVYDLYLEASKEITRQDQSLLEQYAMEVNESILSRRKYDAKKPIGFIYPNAAGITAAICILLHAYEYMEISFFLAGRAQGWIEQLPCNKQLEQADKEYIKGQN